MRCIPKTSPLPTPPPAYRGRENGARRKCHVPDRGQRGFTLTELLVAIGIIALLSGVVLSMVSRARMAGQSARCLSNLHVLSAAFAQYAADNDGRYPDPLSAGASWESLLDQYMTQPMVYACPADAEIFPVVGSSYDWRDVPEPDASLAGRRLSDVQRTDAVLAFETLPGWHGRRLINALLINGAAVTLDADGCLGDLHRSVLVPNPPPFDAKLINWPVNGH